jgi:O-antigen/teichoic acid export membrane protein
MIESEPDGDEGVTDILRAERGRRLRRSIISGLLLRPLALIILIVTVPLFLSYLGKERYGLYETIIGLSMWLSLSNIGLTTGLVNKLTDCEVAGDTARAQRYVSSLWFTMIGVFGIATLLASISIPFIPWTRVFTIEDLTARSEVALVVWATALVTFLQSAMTIPAAAYTATQQIEKYNYWDGASKLAMLTACVLVVHTRCGLLGVAMAVLGIPCAIRVINTIILFVFERPALRPKLSCFEAGMVQSMLADGICIFVLQMASIAIFQTDKLIIGSVLDARQVADFAILGRVFLLAYGVFALGLGSIWPAYKEAAKRGDIIWVKRRLRESLYFGPGLMIACGIAMFFFGDIIVRHLPKMGEARIAKPLVVGVTALFTMRAFVDCQSVLLNAVDVLKPQMWLLGGNAALNTVLAIVLARYFGVVGVAWAFPISAACTSLWGYPLLVRKMLRSYESAAELAQPSPDLATPVTI